MNEFEQLVFDMRTQQKLYFSTPKQRISEKQAILKKSKELERKVDEHLKQKSNPSLF